MPESKYTPVKHDHVVFLSKARQKPGFTEAYDAMALEYAVDRRRKWCQVLHEHILLTNDVRNARGRLEAPEEQSLHLRPR